MNIKYQIYPFLNVLKRIKILRRKFKTSPSSFFPNGVVDAELFSAAGFAKLFTTGFGREVFLGRVRYVIRMTFVLMVRSCFDLATAIENVIMFTHSTMPQILSALFTFCLRRHHSKRFDAVPIFRWPTGAREETDDELD